MKEYTKEEILVTVKEAFEKDQFCVYYQPQYNNFTGLLVGAEALSRLVTEEDIIPPVFFIPVLEENGLIGKLDKLVFEKSCAFLAKCVKENAHIVPISVNLSRDDIYTDGFIDELDAIREKYGIPVNFVHVEVTESIASSGGQRAKEIVDDLHRRGYVVALDDFGSGYSSLNILKDIDYDILKMDMAFLSDDIKGKGGTIISSVVRMAKWLKMPVISEGIETKEQADFMKSIGCEYAQGYLFSKPMREEEYYDLLKDTYVGSTDAMMQMKETINPISFWSEKSLDTLVFNSYVGPAAVFCYDANENIEFLRVNKKYVRELGMNMTEEDIIKSDLFDTMDEEAKKSYKKMLIKAIRSEEEQECETWRTIHSSCCGDERLFVRASVILVGKSENEYIFYASIRNITAEKRQLEEGAGYENKFKNVIEQANIYYWEYTVATKEMRPCFRCMRDLGLPPLVQNYPEPAIEQGIFPQDYADMYRDWHKQIAEGVPYLEAVIPLTVGRVPFHVRYTTEFDELGRPVKAYGSATFVTDKEMEEYMKKNPEQ